jgi:Ca2+-binding RTX toxin-like protein
VLYQIDSHGVVAPVQGPSGDALTLGGESGGFTQFDGRLHFFASDPTLGDVLFQLDGAGHATAVNDPTNTGPLPYFGVAVLGEAHFTVSNGNLYIDALTAEGDELVRIDSTNAAHVIDINTDATGNSVPGSDGGFGTYTPTPMLVGTAGHDVLIGGTGNETLIGGKGNDSIIGGGASIPRASPEISRPNRSASRSPTACSTSACV